MCFALFLCICAFLGIYESINKIKVIKFRVKNTVQIHVKIFGVKILQLELKNGERG